MGYPSRVPINKLQTYSDSFFSRGILCILICHQIQTSCEKWNFDPHLAIYQILCPIESRTTNFSAEVAEQNKEMKKVRQ
ncbi:hypothetical protein RIF29_23928 [Crotalaria pallida]|uniref:Uncharacterized protein n=1 Tax=Crotalaria pallida TaxID=3830 RepID=A0AAN9HZP0_CROPI